MSSEDNSFSEFLDDYFTESEEHLGSLRRHLLVLERYAGRNHIDPDIIDELLSALHSLKGLSAMAGIHEAEEVAHALEGSLRDLKQTGKGPTEAAMEALATGAAVIEQVVSARRDRKPSPEINAIVSRLATVVAPAGSCWRFRFEPSAELSSRGINVNSIQSRLQGIGRLLSATPHIAEGGLVTFDFIVAGDVEERRFSAWQSDGVTVTAYSVPVDVAPVEAAPETAPAGPAPSVVRVEMKRLDHLMTMVGDLVITLGHAEEALRRLEAVLPVSAWRELQEISLVTKRQLRYLREGIMRVRMVPIGQIFDQMRFVIRGLERESHKNVQLQFEGQDTEIDKLLVERMMDPLLHMVRNSVSHGLETSEERIVSGKQARGHLRLCASAEAETVVIELEDDGRGVDIEQVRRRALELGLIESGETLDTATDSSQVLRLLCSPGFSTREQADLGSGRGIGMTVVKAAINGLGGTLAMDTQPGKGTRFTIRLPLTLAIMQALIVYIDDQPFTVPRSEIHEVLRVETDAVTMRENSEVIPYRGGVLPIVHLHRLFGMDSGSTTSFHVLVAGPDLSKVGIAVDRIAGQREIVVRPIEDPLVRVPGVAGVTELGNGRPVLILDTAAIVDGLRISQREFHAYSV